MAQINTRIILRNDTTGNWETVKDTVVLLRGEPGLEYFEEGLVKIKFGDGIRVWKDLPYFGGAHEDIDSAIKAINSRLTGIDSAIVALNDTIGTIEEGKTVVDLIYEAEQNAVNTILGEGVSESFDTLKEIAEYIKVDQEGALALTEKIKALEVATEKKKYEIASLPTGAVVDYNDKEIRIFCAKNTEWIKQNVGENGNANMYYASFKAYAPSGATNFKEGFNQVEEKYFDFNDSFAGTDKYGRNYSICWLALASYDETSNTWTYFGKNSTKDKYIGWTYVVEWYDESGVMIGSDSIRINLSNEDCHNLIEPYYLTSAIKNAFNDLPIATIENLGLVKASNEIIVAEDGALKIGEVSTDKLVQGTEWLILTGGTAKTV